MPRKNSDIILSLRSSERALQAQEKELLKEKQELETPLETHNERITLYEEALNRIVSGARTIRVGAINGWLTLGYSIGGKVHSVEDAKREVTRLKSQRVGAHMELNKIHDKLSSVRRELKEVQRAIERQEKLREKQPA